VVSNAPKTDQTISFNPALTGTVGKTATLSATASSGLTAITFATSSPSTVCTISGNTVSFVGAGNCTVTANQVGNDKFNAAKQVSATIVVSNAPKTDQTISFSPALTGTVGKTATLSATASSNLTEITFATSSPSTVCTISGNTVSFVGAGNCIVSANQAGNEAYNAAASVSANIAVTEAQAKKDQVLALTSPFGKVGEVGTLTAISDAGLTDISFTTSSTEVCDITGNTITYKAEGACMVTMTQAGNAQFNAATRTVEMTVVSKGVFSIGFTNKKGKSIFDARVDEEL
jgi:hypothetical protein